VCGARRQREWEGGRTLFPEFLLKNLTQAYFMGGISFEKNISFLSSDNLRRFRGHSRKYQGFEYSEDPRILM